MFLNKNRNKQIKEIEIKKEKKREKKRKKRREQLRVFKGIQSLNF